MIRAVFFDIDGTLKPFDEHELRDTTIQMLADLQSKGIRIFVASGRPPVQRPLLGEKFNSVPWDGMILLNAGCAALGGVITRVASKKMNMMQATGQSMMIGGPCFWQLV